MTQVATPGELGKIADAVRTTLAGAARSYEIVAQGTTPPDAAAAALAVGPWAEAGATWWLDADWGGATVGSIRERIGIGPPRPERST